MTRTYENDDLTGVLHHVEINVADLLESSRFWGWLLPLLGYVEYQRWESGVSWRLGVTYLVFVQVSAKHAGGRYHRGAVGLNHLAFHLPNGERFHALVAELRARGITILYEDRHPYAGGRDHLAVFFEDPDRIKVEVVGPSCLEQTSNQPATNGA